MSSTALQRLGAAHVDVDEHQPQYFWEAHEDVHVVSSVAEQAVIELAMNIATDVHLQK